MKHSESRALIAWVSPQVVLLERLTCAMVATAGNQATEGVIAASCFGPSPVLGG